MPKWIHDRARHIQAKNPSMPESEAFAIATQQSHSVGESPKGYGTAKGRRTAKAKYDTPGDDKKTADPGHIGKEAGLFGLAAPLVQKDQDERMRLIVREELKTHKGHSNHHSHSQHPSTNVKIGSIGTPFALTLVEGFSDELQKIKTASLTMNSVAPKPTVSSQITARAPRNTLHASSARYSQINPAPQAGPAQTTQPLMSPPAVRG
jgi:hypothetical protein